MITASKFGWSWPPSALSQTHSIMASKRISTLTRSRPPSVALNLHNCILQVWIIIASKCISNLAWSRPPGVSPTRSNIGCKFVTSWPPMSIYKHAQSWSPSGSLRSLGHRLQLYLQILSITAFKGISQLALSQHWSVSLSSFNCHFEGHLTLLSGAACSQSRYSVCSWVAI